MNCKRLFHLSFLLFTFATATAAEYFASPTAVDDESKTCGSVETAGTLTNAFARATAAEDVVTLLPGTYDMTAFTAAVNTSVVNNKYKSYLLANKAITVRSQSGDPEDTILLGGGSSVDGRCFAFNAAATVESLTISNFYTSGSAAAIYSTTRTLFVTNCLLNGNSSAATPGALYQAKAVGCTFDNNYSAVYGAAGSSCDFVNCTFPYNWCKGNEYAGKGGVIRSSTAVGCVFNSGYMTTYMNTGVIGSDSTLSNCVIRNCVKANRGLFLNCTFYDCVFSNNWYTASNGACGLVNASTVYRCIFVNNHAKANYGNCAYGSTCYDCQFIGNVCTNTTYYNGGGAGYGGKYYNCHFIENKTNTYSPTGGALSNPSVVSNCVFVGNVSDCHGGAISCGGNSPSLSSAGDYLIIDSYFTNNVAGASGKGGAISGGTVSNCVLYGNSLSGSGSGSGAGAYCVKIYDSVIEHNTEKNYHFERADARGWRIRWRSIASSGITAKPVRRRMRRRRSTR